MKTQINVRLLIPAVALLLLIFPGARLLLNRLEFKSESNEITKSGTHLSNRDSQTPLTTWRARSKMPTMRSAAGPNRRATGRSRRIEQPTKRNYANALKGSPEPFEILDCD